MEAQTQAPDTAATVTIRARPQIQVAPLGPPSEPTWIGFRHPANDFPFLWLPALDSCPPAFGVHYGTALTACEILACNKKGYLSTSRDRHGDGRVNVDEDSIISCKKYYYHLTSPEPEALYPICIDFSCWEFPHNAFPPAWKSELGSSAQTPVVWPSNWSSLSEKIKTIDMQCLVSGSEDSLTTSHLIAKVEERWLDRNRMNVYLRCNPPFINSPSNLFALRCDLRLCHFDQAGFVIVPKHGQLVVHFLQPTKEVAQCYHNVHFDRKNRLSHEALYARFAWALMKNAKTFLQGTKQYFNLKTSGGNNSGEVEGSGGEDGSSDEGDGDDDGGDSGGHGPGRGGRGRGGSRRGRGGPTRGSGGKRGGSGGKKGGSGGKRGGQRGLKRKRDEENKHDESHHGAGAMSSDRRSGSHTVSDTNPQKDGSQALSDSEARELEKDMKVAARTLPFFLDPNGIAEPGRYETLPWYPGIDIVERKKKAYLDAHPEIRAHSDQLLPDDYDSSNDEDLVSYFQPEYK